MVVVILIAVVVVIFLGGGVLTHNGLVNRRNRTQEAGSEIDVDLKRQHDLIPNRVETVPGYVAHELVRSHDATGGVPYAAAPARCKIRLVLGPKPFLGPLSCRPLS